MTEVCYIYIKLVSDSNLKVMFHVKHKISTPYYKREVSCFTWKIEFDLLILVVNLFIFIDFILSFII